MVEIEGKKNENIIMHKAKLKQLGKNIKFLRKAKNLSQEDLAEKINKSRNYIGMIERAEVNTPIDTLFDISDILKTDIKSFFED